MTGFEEIPGTDSSAAAAAASVGGAEATPLSAQQQVDVQLPVRNLLHFANGSGLNIDACFSRAPSMYSDTMQTIRLTLGNMSDYPLQNVRVASMNLEDGMSMQPFVDIVLLAPHTTTTVNIHIDFNQRTTDARFEVAHSRGTYAIKLAAPPGELLRPSQVSQQEFDKETGR